MIFAFNQQLLETSISFLIQIPILGPKQEVHVAKQKKKLHSKTSKQVGSIS
jgi:hypothetical protein